MRARDLASLAVVATFVACSDMPHKDVPPPGSAGTPRNPLVTDEPRATPAETSPVPSPARAILEDYVKGALEPRDTALAMERILAKTEDGPMKVTDEWTVGTRRALTHTLRVTPRELRSELRRYQDELSRFETASIPSDVAANRFEKVIGVADRYPNASFAQSLWTRLEKERALAPKELVDTAALTAPVPVGGIRVGGLQVKADGDDALVAQDVDGNTVWEHRARAAASETPSLRVLGTFADRLVAIELTKSGAELDAIDIATGSVVSRVALPAVKTPPTVALLGPDAIIAIPHRVFDVDLLRRNVAGSARNATTCRSRSARTGSSSIQAASASTSRPEGSSKARPASRAGKVRWRFAEGSYWSVPGTGSPILSSAFFTPGVFDGIAICSPVRMKSQGDL